MASKDADLEKPKDIKFDGVVVDICFHPIKDVIAAGDIAGEVSLHSYSTTRENSTLMTFKNHKKGCRALRFSANGEELYTASKDKSIHIVDMNTGALKRKFKKAHEHSYSTTRENSTLMTFKNHKKGCRALRFSANGEELYTASKDKSIHIVDMNTGALKRKFKKAHEHSYSTTRENSTLMTFKNHKKGCRALRFSANGEELYTASKDKSIHIVDMNTGALKRKFKKAHEHSYSTTRENSTLMTFKNHKKGCRALRFSANGEELYTASKDKSIHIVDMNTGALKRKFKKAHEHSYSTTRENSTLMTFKNHKKGCRALRFSANGEELYTASKDKSIHIVDMNTGALKRKFKKAHESPIYSMLVTGEHFLATGDDDGNLKLWDIRTNSAEMEVKHNEEFISDMAIDDQHKILITTSGDGTLTAFNIRRKRMDIQSELFDSELLSLARLKEKEKVVCGTGEGVLNIFNWGQWGNISDRFPGHPLSVDCMVAVTENIICTGSSDGIVRAVNILPNRFLGVVGDHDSFPVENLSLSHDGNLLASCSHDQTVKFWNTSDFRDLSVSTKTRAKKGNTPNKLGSTAKNDFFAGLADDNADDKKEEDESDDEDDDSDSDDDDDSDEEP